jgi:hypothetical protein
MILRRCTFPLLLAVLWLASCARQPSHLRVLSTGYPYLLTLGHSVYSVEREPASVRLRIALLRWTENSGGQDAVFRVTNPGDRAVLVWNVRQQVLANDSGASTWSTQQSDYPGRRWDRSDITTGGSVEFPMFSPCEGEWRVCLLYSRELLEPKSPNRRFDGTFELIGPAVTEEQPPEAQPDVPPNSRPESAT